MSDHDSFEAWKRSMLEEQAVFLQKNAAAPPDKQLNPEQLAGMHAVAMMKIEAADAVHRYLVAAREIGKSVIPNGTSTNVIDIAKFLYEVECDVVAANMGEDDDDDDDGDGPPQEPPGPVNRQQRRWAERHGR